MFNLFLFNIKKLFNNNNNLFNIKKLFNNNNNLFNNFSLLNKLFCFIQFCKIFKWFLFSCIICIFCAYLTFLILENNLWGFNYLFSIYFFDLIFIFRLDIFSLVFINLTNILMIICLWSSYESNNGIKYRRETFRFLLIILQIIVILCFCVGDLLNFYILFEITLIPMLLIIGGWGLRQRKIHAVFLFVLYTFIGSIFFLIAIILLINQKGHLDINFLSLFSVSVLSISISDRLIWIFIFIALCVKIPLFPFHLWLPEAHVEAPTIGSMLLAGILLKLGTYGIIRFLFPLYPYGLQYFYPIISLFCIIAIIYISFTALCQIDLKKIVAYSSIAHMSYVILGMCSFSKLSIIGSIYLMLAHGFASAGLFYIIGCLYSRYHTRIIFYYGGLITTMPIFSVFFFFHISKY